MSFALIQIEPLKVLQSFPAEHPPDPVVWPNGDAGHGVAPGYRHAEWMLTRVAYAPEAPNEFYEVAECGLELAGDLLTYRRTWRPRQLDAVRSELLARIDVAAEAARARHLTPGAGQMLIYAQKLAEAQGYLKATRQAGSYDDYPLLAASVDLEAPTLAAVAKLIVERGAQWSAAASAIEGKRLRAKAQMRVASSVDAAVAVWNALVWD